MSNILNLKRRVMARIYLLYLKSAFMKYPDYFMFGVFVIVSIVVVSYRDVLINMPKDNLPNTFNFFWAALWKTSWIIQALIAGFLIRVVVAGSKSTYRNIRSAGSDWTKWLPIKFRY